MTPPRFLPSPQFHIGQVVVYKQPNNTVISVNTIREMCWLQKHSEWRYYLDSQTPLKSTDIIPYSISDYGEVDLRAFPTPPAPVKPDITNL